MMRLRTKISLFASVLFAGLFMIMSVTIYAVFHHISYDNDLNRVHGETIHIANGIKQAAGEIPSENLLRAYVPLQGMLRIVLEDGTSLSTATSSSERQLIHLPITYGVRQFIEKVSYEGTTYAQVSVPIIWHDGRVVNVQVTESLRVTDTTLNSLRFVLVTVSVLAMIPVFLGSGLLSSWVIKPITSLMRIMKEIQRSGQFKRLPETKRSKDELTEMGDTFNHMIDLLETHFTKQKQFVSHASHELKTPLTIIESYANLLKRRGLQHPEVFEESVEAIHSEAIRMKELTEQLLLLAKPQEHWDMKFESLEIAPLVTETVNAFARAYDRVIEVEVDGGQNGLTNVYTDPSKLKQLLFIFLDNARKYSEKPIRVIVTSEGQACIIRVEDRGIGIPKHEIERVFERFYRVDQARSRIRDGFGLGLTLAQEMAGAMGANIRIKSEEAVGTTVVLTLPKDGVSPNEVNR